MKKFNEIFAQKIGKRTVLISGLLYLAFLGIMMSIPNGIISLSQLGNGNIFDLRTQYNLADFHAFFKGNESELIKGYAKVHMLDIPYALCYTSLLIALIYRTKAYEYISYAVIGPVAAFTFDMLENKYLSDAYNDIANASEGLIAMASTMSSLKWIAVFASIFTLIYALIVPKKTNSTNDLQEEEYIENGEEENLS